MEKPVTEARFEHEGFPCVVLLMPMGHRCGYVGVPKTHPAYGGYDELDIDCHGGLTYAEGHLQNQDDTETWWIGFDCAHWLDAPDEEAVQKYFPETYERLRNTTYYQAREWSVHGNRHRCTRTENDGNRETAGCAQSSGSSSGTWNVWRCSDVTPKPWENSSGYPDPTAYEAEKNISAEEKRKNELIYVLKYIIRTADFELLNRLEVRDNRTGKIWR